MIAYHLPTLYTCFPGGKNKALTMSYDDGRSEDYQLVKLFNEHGIKATFNLNGGIHHDERRIPIDEYTAVYAGHEIACHTYTHPTIARCPLEQVAWQIHADRLALENVTGRPVCGLAYPNGSYSGEIMQLLPALGIRYARVVPTSSTFDMPSNWYAWENTCHHSQRLMEYARQFTEICKPQRLHLMSVWGHSYEFTERDGWDVIREFCEYIGGRDDIWYATNIEIVDYMDAAIRLRYTAAGDYVYNPNACSIWLRVTPPDSEPSIIEVLGGKGVKLF